MAMTLEAGRHPSIISRLGTALEGPATRIGQVLYGPKRSDIRAVRELDAVSPLVAEIGERDWKDYQDAMTLLNDSSDFDPVKRSSSVGVIARTIVAAGLDSNVFIASMRPSTYRLEARKPGFKIVEKDTVGERADGTTGINGGVIEVRRRFQPASPWSLHENTTHRT